MTAWFSATHLIGFTLVMSGGLIFGLRASGVLLRHLPIQSIARPAFWLLAVGLTISLITGSALFAPRASYTAPIGVFQLKIALVLVAGTYQLALNSTVLRRSTFSVPLLRASGVLGLVLWISLAVVACWFILFE